MDDFKINKDFANKYNKYREKEELQKLKSRYGDVNLTSDSSESESEDETAEAVTPQLERDFLRTLSYLKKKDPAIYDESKKFYQEQDSDSATSSENEKKKSKPSKPMYLKDYERKVILENEGKFIEDEPEDKNRRKREASPSYHEEQIQLQEDIKKAVDEVMIEENKDSSDEGGGLLVKRKKSSVEKEQQEKVFREWLKTTEGKSSVEPDGSNISTSELKTEVAPLKEYWTDPNLDEGEKFLRDYILDRKYLDPDADSVPTYDEIVGSKSDEEMSESEDEFFEKKSEIFEKKYNFRFEEPDEEFIKSYPRTIGTSVRRKEDGRKKKRQEQKMRAEEKKKKKQEELKQLKLLKRKEILEKIQKLQEATGNKDIEFSEKDLREDFDPEEYDRRMHEIFENYDGEVDEQKPVFSDLEDELEDYERYWDEDKGYNPDVDQLDCEDPDFNMDCDFDPSEHQRKKAEKKAMKNKSGNPILVEKKKKKSPFYDSVAKPKPHFDPNEKSFEKYLDEYYALDYEDIIGDLPCRFKYRQVVPNDFGLSTEEILTATDRELNSWCSLKRAIQHRAEEDEIRDLQKYKRKGKNVWKKARVLKSVYKMPGEEEEATTSEKNGNNPQDGRKHTKMNSRKRRRMKERAEKMRQLQDDTGQYDSLPVNTETDKIFEQPFENGTAIISGQKTSLPSSEKMRRPVKMNKNQKHKQKNKVYSKISKLSNERLKAYGLEPKKFLKKMQYGNTGDGT